MPDIIAPKYDTLSPRFIAGFIDGMVLVAIGIIDEMIYSLQIRWLALAWLPIASSTGWLYFVVAHRVYGKTLGKHVMKVSVVDHKTEGPISWTQAFLRESFYIVLAMYALVMTFYATYYNITESTPALTAAAWIVMYAPVAWFVVEVVTAVSNNKRRAIHDLIAGTVVIKVEPPEVDHDSVIADWIEEDRK